MKANYIEYELESGEQVTMTITMGLLYKLRVKNKAIYEDVSKNLIEGPNRKDVIDIAKFLYGAYVCANQEEQPMSFEAFIEDFNQDYKYNSEIMEQLINPKKKQDSETPS